MNRPYEPPRIEPFDPFVLSEATAAAEDDRLARNDRRDLLVGLAAVGVLAAALVTGAVLAGHGLRALATSAAHS